MQRRGFGKLARPRTLLIAGGLLLVAASGMAAAYHFEVWPFQTAEPPPPVVTTPEPERKAPLPVARGSKSTGSKHASPNQVLTLTLLQLHQEALQHFHSDPRNGLARMPMVYEKVVKEWKMPFFSPGELETEEGTKPHPDLASIHGKSVKHFLNPVPLRKEEAAGETLPTVTVHDLAAFSDLRSGKRIWAPKTHWEARNVDLIGLLSGPEPVAYVSEMLPEMEKTGVTPKRPLDDFEIVGLTALKKGDETFSRSREGVVRMLGAVRANTSCISCHEDRKEGDLLGAFSYTLREAEYTRKAWGAKGTPVR